MDTPPRPADVNYDESRIAPFDLPESLRCQDGSAVLSAAQWFEKRRPELLSLFKTHIYGRVPARCSLTTLARRSDSLALSGMATRYELDIRLCSEHDGARELDFRVALWVPNDISEPVPAFVGLNFFGNHSVHADPGLQLARGWLPNRAEYHLVEHTATEASRGCQSECWPLSLIVSRGYAFATAYAGDWHPDHPDGFRSGAQALFLDPGTRPAADEWGAIGAWAWGLSHLLDALEQVPAVNAKRVAVVGHSRLGKAALWAGALDERFAMAISNQSGRGGAALSRRRFGELTRDLNRRFPHWFCANFRRYDDREAELPVDQHQLLALLAPRPVYVASAALDLWADPKGEYLACQHADEVYRLLGKGGLSVTTPEPVIGDSLGDTIGYHRRDGAHDITRVDWAHYLAFADRHFR